jgi:hypothetical protein
MKTYLRTYLIAQSIGTTANIFIDLLPDAPDSAISINEYGGKDKGVLEERRLQIVCRDNSYAAAESKALAIRALLSNDNPELRITLNSIPYYFKSIQRPFLLSRDERQRCKFVCNYKVV